MSQLHTLFQNNRQADEPPHSASQAPAKILATFGTAFEQIPTVAAQLQPKDRAVFHTDPASPAADRFRLLRMRLTQHWSMGQPRSLLITSPLPHDGKSTVAMNLASALCEQGKFKVLLVEADLHHVFLTRKFGLAPWPGLAECLRGQVSPIAAIRRIEPLQWYLLPAGDPPENPTDLLHTSALDGIMRAIVPLFDWVLIDSPPVLPVTDSLSLSQHVGGTLLVVRAGSTPDEAVEQSIVSLGKQNLVGVVLNSAERVDRLYSQYGYYRAPGGTAAK